MRRFGSVKGADSAWFSFTLQPLTVAKGTLNPEIPGSRTYDIPRDALELEITLTRIELPGRAWADCENPGVRRTCGCPSPTVPNRIDDLDREHPCSSRVFLGWFDHLSREWAETAVGRIEEVRRRLDEDLPRLVTYSYCSAGYGVLERLVEVLRKMPYPSALRRYLADPLSIEELAFSADEALAFCTADLILRYEIKTRP